MSKRTTALKNLYSKLDRKKVMITQASNPNYWYAKFIGQELTVFETKSNTKENSWTVDDGEFDSFIKKEDCTLVSFK